MQKGSIGHHNLLPPMMVPPESIIMPYPGHGPWPMIVPIPGHMSAPPLGCPCPSSSNMAPGLAAPGAITPSKPVTSSGLTVLPVPVPSCVSTSSSKPLLISCSSYCISSPSLTTVSSCSSYSAALPITTPRENSAKSEDSEGQGSHPSSPTPARGKSPPPSLKAQVCFLRK